MKKTLIQKMKNWQEFCFVNLPQAVVVTSEDFSKVFFVNKRARFLFFLQSKEEFDDIMNNLFVLEVSFPATLKHVDPGLENQ
jgi:uncharacterized protein YlbG (UPF0298 family)